MGMNCTHERALRRTGGTEVLKGKKLHGGSGIQLGFGKWEELAEQREQLAQKMGTSG